MRPHGKNQHQTSSSSTTSEEFDPQEFFIDVALLISEARFPDKNAGGRGEGPHCPDVGGIITTSKSSQQPLQVPLSHICDQNQANCRQARHIVDESVNLWSRNIPSCLYVFLLPDQCSNVAECLLSDAVLLERWTIQALPKRNTDKRLLPAQFLLQAIRSHLHFSQLSAWLIESRGKSPANVTYRVTMPGESDDGQKNIRSNVNSTNEKHQFPTCLLGKSLILNVSVESLARPFDFLSLQCRCFNSGFVSSSSTTNVVVVVETTTPVPNEVIGESSSTSSNEIKDPVSTPNHFNRDQPTSSMTSNVDSSVSTLSSDDYYSSPLTPSTSSNDIEDESASTSTSSRPLLSTYEPISLPSINFTDDDFTSIRTKPSGETKIKTSAFNCSATNPLFDSTYYGGDEISLKQRIDSLRLEAQQLSTKWRRFADPSMKKNQPKPASEVRFFVPDDDEDDAESSTTSFQNRSLFDDNPSKVPSLNNLDDSQPFLSQRLQSASTSAAAAAIEQRVIKCRKILFSGEDELFHNAEDVPSLIDFVVQPNADDAGSSTSTSNEHSGGGAVKRKESLNDRLCRRQNESSLFARKWTKKTTHNAAVLQFNRRTGLPLSSSPAPLKRNQNSFNFDSSLSSVTAIKNAFYNNDHESGSSDSDSGVPLCKSAPASTNLLGNFEESALNGRIKPFGSVDGFTLELGASGAFCPSHVTLPVTTLFFTVSDDNAPSPYFGHCNLEHVGRKGYHTPKKGTVQATLFNPQGTVVKMFVVRYDLSDMPNGCQTFVRQRTFFMPSSATLDDALRNRSWLRYLIHLRFATSRSGKLYLHSDIRMLFSRKSELDAYNIDYACSTTNVETYELRSFTEMPKNPKFSPKKLNGRQDKEKEIYV